MTFGLAFISSTHAGVVTDRLLTRGRFTDDSTKCGVALFRDGRLAYTMAGLAETASFKARHWIAETLVRAAEPGRPMEPTLEAFTQAATDIMRTLAVRRQEDRRMSVAFVGLRRNPLGFDQSVMALVSNFEHFEDSSPPEVWDQFRLSLRVGPLGQATAILTVGCGDLPQREVDRVADLLRNSRVPSSETVHQMVGLIRDAAARDSSGRIGTVCSSVILDFKQAPLRYDFHPDRPTVTSRLPALACAIYGNVGAYVTVDGSVETGRFDGTPDIAHVPRQSGKRMCGCGSGKRYKNCHGRSGAAAIAETGKVGTDVLVIARPDDGSAITLLGV